LSECEKTDGVDVADMLVTRMVNLLCQIGSPECDDEAVGTGEHTGPQSFDSATTPSNPRRARPSRRAPLSTSAGGQAISYAVSGSIHGSLLGA
jgi:hypothetical protein